MLGEKKVVVEKKGERERESGGRARMVIGDSSRGDNEPAAVLLTAEVGDDTPTTETFDEGKTAKKESTISFFFCNIT